MPKKSVKSGKKDDKVLFAFLATFLSIIGFIIALIAKRDDKYVMFYAKQSLIVFIVAVVLGIAGSILRGIPGIGVIILAAINIITFILWLLSWIYALSGEEKQVPVVGAYARNFKF